MARNPAASLLTLFLFVLLFQLFGRYLLDYALDEDGLSFRLFRRFRFMRIRYAEISEVRQQSRLGLAFSIFSLHLNNRLFGGSVFIAKRRGLYRSVTITPDDPAVFAEELRQRCG